MPEFATLPIPPRYEPADDRREAEETTVAPLTRSEDLCLAERVGRALRATGYGALRGIEVSVQARIVHIEGRVPSYYLKQIAQETAVALSGTRRIHNGLDVMPST